MNRERGVATVVFCYALGKAQRVLAELAPLTARRCICTARCSLLIAAYRAAGVDMVPTEPAASARSATTPAR